jgi:hypothetical protein
MAAPLIQLDAGGTASVLRYDIPEPTSYEGKNFIKLEFDDNVFAAVASEMPSKTMAKLADLPEDVVRSEAERYLRTGVSARRELPNMSPADLKAGLISGGTIDVGPAQPPPDDGETPPSPPTWDDIVGNLAEQLKEGVHLVKSTDLYGDTTVTPEPEIPDEPDPHLYLIESFRLTSYLGDYGAGRIVKTFSLLPGETSKISVKTFRQTETTKKEASSVLDSLTKESATELQDSLTTEQSDQKSYQQTKEYYAEASGSASWGIGSASGKAGVKGSTNSARQESVKNVSNATQKHSARASAKREVDIDTSFEVSEKEGEETSIERLIENINLSRTLNFVFRQMNQEFITFLHLTDVRVGFFNGDGQSRREVPLNDLGRLLDEVVKSTKRNQVEQIILDQLSGVRDYVGNVFNVVDVVQMGPGDEYRQFDPGLVTNYVDPSGRSYDVPGVLLKVDRLVMRTEGIIVEALLGQGPALDSYAEKLQELEVKRRKALVAKHEHLADQLDLVNQAIQNGDEAKAAIAEHLVCRCCLECKDAEPEPERPSPSQPTPPT